MILMFDIGPLLKGVNRAWAETYYSKPALELFLISSLVAVWRFSKNSKLKGIAQFFYLIFFLLFFVADLVFAVYQMNASSISYLQFSKVYEILNGLFIPTECYIAVTLANYEIRDPLLKRATNWLRLFLFFDLVILFPILLSKRSFVGVILTGELASGISFALLTVYLTVYYIVIYRRNIMSTFVTPSLYAYFCYVVVSLLLFPISAFLRAQRFTSIALFFNIYHEILILIFGAVLFYNVIFHPRQTTKYLQFEF